MSEATEAAFSSAVRATLAGSNTPAFIKSSYSPVLALYPQPGLISLTFSITRSAETPAFLQI